MLSATFFVVSLIEVPMWPSSVHLLLTGLMGLVLGWAAFPAVLIALLLQAVLFQVGGLTTLGVNTLVMATAGSRLLLPVPTPGAERPPSGRFLERIRRRGDGHLDRRLLLLTALTLAGKEFVTVGRAIFAAHLLLAPIEGLITGSVVVLLRKVRPEVLGSPLLAHVPQEV